IEQSRYVTVSANVFHLMRGSGIHREYQTFQIEQVSDVGDISLVLQFKEPERNKNEAFAYAAAESVFRAEFMPDAEDPGLAESLWHFIDQTGMFYVQKVVHRDNPFRALVNRRN